MVIVYLSYVLVTLFAVSCMESSVMLRYLGLFFLHILTQHRAVQRSFHAYL